jgi:hypothetical protein
MAEKQTEEVKMVAPTQPKIEMVKVKLLRPYLHETTKRVHQPGEIIDVSKEDAKWLTSESWGAYAFRGERHIVDGDVKRHSLKRAELVA